MQKSLLSPELFFSDEPMYAADGLLNVPGLRQNNAQLELEYEWLDSLFAKRSNSITEQEEDRLLPFDILTAPEILAVQGPFAHQVNKSGLGTAERILLLLVLEPYYRPLVMADRLAEMMARSKKEILLYGYFKDQYAPGYYPTLQTFFYLCAGKDVAKWRDYEQEIIHHGKLFNEQIIALIDPDERKLFGNRLSNIISIAPEYVDYFLHGRKPRPDFGRNFPAKWVTTNLSWDHLVLNHLTRQQIADVMDWVEHGKSMLARSERQVNQSFPCLFYGPPGTGKSLTAKLIGKQYGKDVFRVDLSMVISKYIGETEKNLAQLFDRAEGKDWVLFFDEADALFGKRTGISDSKDKWANLEMSYLLQRMEEYEGLCILASNLKNNIDPAMSRRFQSIIYFPWPKPEERALLWEKSLPPGFSYPDDISFSKLCNYDFSGAGIANIIKACCLKAVKRGDYVLSTADIIRFIRIEYAKDNRTP